jgi:hypothetical protein
VAYLTPITRFILNLNFAIRLHRVLSVCKNARRNVHRVYQAQPFFHAAFSDRRLDLARDIHNRVAFLCIHPDIFGVGSHLYFNFPVNIRNINKLVNSSMIIFQIRQTILAFGVIVISALNPYKFICHLKNLAVKLIIGSGFNTQNKPKSQNKEKKVPVTIITILSCMFPPSFYCHHPLYPEPKPRQPPALSSNRV